MAALWFGAVGEIACVGWGDLLAFSALLGCRARLVFRWRVYGRASGVGWVFFDRCIGEEGIRGERPWAVAMSHGWGGLVCLAWLSGLALCWIIDLVGYAGCFGMLCRVFDENTRTQCLRVVGVGWVYPSWAWPCLIGFGIVHGRRWVLALG